MARQPKRMAGPAQLTGSAATQYTAPSYVPTNLTSVVRHIHVQNPSSSPVTFTLSIGTDAAGKRLFDAYSIAANSVLDHFCYYVMTSAEVIQAFASSASTLVITIDGDENV